MFRKRLVMMVLMSACQLRLKMGSSAYLVILPGRPSFGKNGFKLWRFRRCTPMGQRTLVPDAGEVELHELKTDGQNRLVMVLRSVGEDSRCPACGQPSRRVHSRYKRQLNDLPWEGIPVRIELRVRRFSVLKTIALSMFSPSGCRTRLRGTAGELAGYLLPWIESRWRWADLWDPAWRNNWAF